MRRVTTPYIVNHRTVLAGGWGMDIVIGPGEELFFPSWLVSTNFGNCVGFFRQPVQYNTSIGDLHASVFLLLHTTS